VPETLSSTSASATQSNRTLGNRRPRGCRRGPLPHGRRASSLAAQTRPRHGLRYPRGLERLVLQVGGQPEIGCVRGGVRELGGLRADVVAYLDLRRPDQSLGPVDLGVEGRHGVGDHDVGRARPEGDRRSPERRSQGFSGAWRVKIPAMHRAGSGAVLSVGRRRRHGAGLAVGRSFRYTVLSYTILFVLFSSPPFAP